MLWKTFDHGEVKGSLPEVKISIRIDSHTFVDCTLYNLK